jgi:hypothetical protein
MLARSRGLCFDLERDSRAGACASYHEVLQPSSARAKLRALVSGPTRSLHLLSCAVKANPHGATSAIAISLRLTEPDEADQDAGGIPTVALDEHRVSLLPPEGPSGHSYSGRTVQ